MTPQRVHKVQREAKRFRCGVGGTWDTWMCDRCGKSVVVRVRNYLCIVGGSR